MIVVIGRVIGTVTMGVQKCEYLRDVIYGWSLMVVPPLSLSGTVKVLGFAATLVAVGALPALPR